MYLCAGPAAFAQRCAGHPCGCVQLEPVSLSLRGAPLWEGAGISHPLHGEGRSDRVQCALLHAVPLGALLSRVVGPLRLHLC